MSVDQTTTNDIEALVADYIVQFGVTHCPPRIANAPEDRTFAESTTSPVVPPKYWPHTEPTKEMPSQQYLRECFDYDPFTGDLIWKTRPLEHFVEECVAAAWNALHPGKVAGMLKIDNPRYNRFLRVSIGGFEFRANRVIWKWMTGQEPRFVEHNNKDGTDNRWINLRDNWQPRGKGAHTHAVRGRRGTGVTLKKNGRFRAKISINDKSVSLGCYGTREEAEQAYRRAVAELDSKTDQKVA
jgi:AP2 domain